MGLLRFLIIAICILWVVRIVFRLLLPYLLKHLFSKVQNQTSNPNYRQEPGKQSRSTPSDKVQVDYIPPKDKEAIAADRAGDFIDFEEVKE